QQIRSNHSPRGEAVMATTRIASVIGLLVLSLTVGLSLVRAEDNDALRKRALALNDVTGDDTITAEIVVLLKDKEGTKRRLEWAGRMARPKEPPFNYNGAFILARVAQELKDLETAKVMYKICTTSATKLQSGQKLAQSFGGLIDLFYEN